MADPRTPRAAKWLIGCGVGYVLLPIDLIPDFIPFFGKVDDMLVAPILIGLGSQLVPGKVKDDDRSRTRRLYSSESDDWSRQLPVRCEALPAAFGIKIRTDGDDTGALAPLGILSLDLMFEHGLVVLGGSLPTVDQFDSLGLRTARIENTGLCSVQTKIDVGLRPLPLLAAVTYCMSASDEPLTFVDTGALYSSLPPDLKRSIQGLRLQVLPQSKMLLFAELEDDDSPKPDDGLTHRVSGPQFLSLLMDKDSRDVTVNRAPPDELLAELRELMLQDRFVYTHQTSSGSLITWDPRKVMQISRGGTVDAQRYIYPEGIFRRITRH